jgi:hypothetical protein
MDRIQDSYKFRVRGSEAETIIVRPWRQEEQTVLRGLLSTSRAKLVHMIRVDLVVIKRCLIDCICAAL